MYEEIKAGQGPQILRPNDERSNSAPDVDHDNENEQDMEEESDEDEDD